MLFIGVKKPDTVPSIPLCAAPTASPLSAFASIGVTAAAGGSIIAGAALPFTAELCDAPVPHAGLDAAAHVGLDDALLLRAWARYIVSVAEQGTLPAVQDSAAIWNSFER